MNVPKLRFKEFNDEWILKTLKESAEFIQGINTAVDRLEYVKDGIKVLQANNIVLGVLNNDSLKYITDSEYENIIEKYKPKFGDVLYSNIGARMGYAVPFNIHEKVTFTWNVLRMIPNKDINNIFLSAQLNSPQIRNKVLSNASTNTMPFISGQDLKKIKLNFPSMTEQIKIGKTLELLDKKIELQSKKIEDLKLFKKGLLRKEFNNKKCSNKLKECFDFGKAGGTPKSTNKDYYNGYIPFLSISDMTTQGKYIYYTDKSITEAGLNNSTAWLVPKNSIIISMYASYGLVSINKIDLATSQAMFNMVINKNYVVEYIYYYLYYLYISSFYNSIVSTGTQSNLNAEQIKLLDIYIPCYKEQKRIHEQFSKIDFKINLEQKKFNELLYLKKGLMQNMFV